MALGEFVEEYNMASKYLSIDYLLITKGKGTFTMERSGNQTLIKWPNLVSPKIGQTFMPAYLMDITSPVLTVFPTWI